MGAPRYSISPDSFNDLIYRETVGMLLPMWVAISFVRTPGRLAMVSRTAFATMQFTLSFTLSPPLSFTLSPSMAMDCPMRRRSSFCVSQTRSRMNRTNGAVERMVLLGLTSRIIPNLVGARRRWGEGTKGTKGTERTKGIWRARRPTTQRRGAAKLPRVICRRAPCRAPRSPWRGRIAARTRRLRPPKAWPRIRRRQARPRTRPS